MLVLQDRDDRAWRRERRARLRCRDLVQGKQAKQDRKGTDERGEVDLAQLVEEARAKENGRKT